LDTHGALAQGLTLHLAVIQQPVRRWERPWRHQRVIVLFAASPRDMKVRLQAESRIETGEQVLRVIRAGE